MTRTRQSNHQEMCPVCFRILANRMAAMSHYCKHARARAGDVDGRKSSSGSYLKFRLPAESISNALYRAILDNHPDYGWWSNGIRYEHTTTELSNHACATIRDEWLLQMAKGRMHGKR